jgi:hypothetical protein
MKSIQRDMFCWRVFPTLFFKNNNNNNNMTTIKLYFKNNDRENVYVIPFIQDAELTTYKCDGTQGEIYFSGYYYVSNQDNTIDDESYNTTLPQILDMTMTLHEKTPYEYIVNEYNCKQPVYKTIQKESYKIQVDKIVRESGHTCCKSNSDDSESVSSLHNTIESQSDTDEKPPDYTELNNAIKNDDTGSDYDICFFPMCMQTIYFKIIAPLQ